MTKSLKPERRSNREIITCEMSVTEKPASRQIETEKERERTLSSSSFRILKASENFEKDVWFLKGNTK